MSAISAPRRKEIAHAAQRLFRDHGFQATSIRDIARALGLTAGALYSHIRSKEDLLWEIVEQVGQRYFAMLDAVLASDRVVPQKFRDAVRGHVRVIVEDLAAAAVAANDWRHLGDDRRAEFIAQRDRYEAMWQELIRQGIAAGFFGDVDVRFATLFVLSSLNWTYQWYRADGPMTADEVANRMAEFIFDGLRRRA